jgi:hypothetical protein
MNKSGPCKTAMICVFFILGFFSITAQAYTILDNAIVTVVLPPGWKMDNITRKDTMIATSYTKQISKDVSDNISEIQFTRDPTKDPEKLVQTMSDRIKKEVIVQHCDVDPLKVLTVPSKLFKAWGQVIQCQRSQSGIVQIYLDTDPKNLYLITYTISGYPFTPEARKTAMELLSTSIQVCYKQTPCNSFQ